MKQAFGLLALIMAGLEAGRALAGAEAVVAVVSGALALMALMIAATFLWLWFERTTPLALGMAHSWLGAGLLAGLWWWGQRTGAGWTAPPSLALALPAVGATLHFAVIHRSFGHHGPGFLWPMALALAISVLVRFAL